jgi:cardiolipin synthase
MPDADSSQLQLLSDGAMTFAHMLAAIARAERTLHLEVYSFHDDRTGGQFIAALVAAAQRGVRVRVIVDAWGTDGVDRVVAALREGGFDASVYNPLLAGFRGHIQRDHRKLLVVDDVAGFIGGLNISDEFVGEAAWVDLGLELRGAAARALAQQLRSHRETASLPDVKIVLSTAGARSVRRRYLKTISGARQRLVMAQAYFLPDRRLLRAIRAAARRGVEVTLLLPGKSDVPVTHALTRLYYRGLIRAGVKIHEWHQSNLHAKAASVDGQVALLGSFNLDPWSLVNLEVLAEVRRDDIAGEVEAWILDKVARSTPVTLPTSGPLDWPWEAFGRRFLDLSWRTSRALSRWSRGRFR